MDPYKILGVSPDATDEEVKKAYKQLSKKYHPDANINNPNKEQAEEMFKNVQQAYQIIMKQRRGHMQIWEVEVTVQPATHRMKLIPICRRLWAI